MEHFDRLKTITFSVLYICNCLTTQKVVKTLGLARMLNLLSKNSSVSCKL